MNRKIAVRFNFSLLLVSLVVLCNPAFAQTDISGAYEYAQGSTKHVVIFVDDYYLHTAYDQQAKSFKNSEGGFYKLADGNIVVKLEFNTDHKEYVDSIFRYPGTISKDGLQMTYQGTNIKLTKVDNGQGALAGAWRISGRMVEGKFSPMPTGSRKTIKVLSGTRFQWIAIDPKAKEYFGTGGGTYTYTGGKYTETLEFFPRDSSKVGTSLTFDDKIEDGEWYHTGKSSTGAPVFEIWKNASIIVE